MDKQKDDNNENKSNAGQPPFFDTPEKLQDMIDDYFNNVCFITIGTFKNDDGEEIEEKVFKPTITGLALHLGFCSRQSFYDYEKRPKFSYTIKRCRLMLEHYYENKLTSNNVTGIIFALKNMG